MSVNQQEHFNFVNQISFEGENSKNPLAYRFYNPKQLVLGKPMDEHLRISVCLWHTFGGRGADMFGEPTFHPPWGSAQDSIERAKQTVDAAFEFVSKLNIPFISMHDADITPSTKRLKDFIEQLLYMVDYVEEKMAATGIGLLLGSSNLFSNRCFAAGAFTNPDPDIFAYAATQVKHAIEATKRMNGQNYVLWGGRDGYDTLLNTDLKREIEQLGRFLSMLVEHKHKIGFKGALLVEPKPCEPTKHQYDYDVGTVYGFLKRFNLENEIKVNLEANHATLSNHSFEHEVAHACALDLLGSIDVNRGDPQNGWDTDQFPNTINELSLILARLIEYGGFKKGGFNFDAKLRRQSIDLEDLFYAHIGGIDTLAKSLLIAEKMVKDNFLDTIRKERYKKWYTSLGQAIMNGNMNLDTISQHVLEQDINPIAISGHQELHENQANLYLL